jgi:hypothetical protein
MPSSRKPTRKVAVTVKLPAAFAAELREWVRRERGRPLFIASLSSFAEQAFRREMERSDLIVSGVLPLDRATGGDSGDEHGAARRATSRPLNTHH